MTFRSLVPFCPAGQVVTFSVYQYPTAGRFWALAQMGLFPGKLRKVKGLSFGKMMGSGRNFLSFIPDFGRYALLAVWENEKAADEFFASSLMETFRQKASEIWTVKLLPLRTHGKWDGISPFQPYTNLNYPDLPVAVLTRATIRTKALADFWRHVPQASRSLYSSEALLYSIGVGEKPVVQQATVSFWRSAKALEEFAYQQAGHREIVRRTREKKWYSEDLFARFLPVATQGTCGGEDLLARYPTIQPMEMMDR